MIKSKDGVRELFRKLINNLEKILPIINGESPISLRLIDWFN